MISEAMWQEPTLTTWARSFNYFINPLEGTAVDKNLRIPGERHNPPANHPNLSFADGKVLMHEHDGAFKNWTDPQYRISSTRLDARWTMLHELGHLLFNLADEYLAGEHWEADCPAPPCHQNNWKDESQATADVVLYPGKTATDVHEIGYELNLKSGWYKICAAHCQMDAPDPANPDRTIPATFDLPCADRILYLMLFGSKVP